MSGIRTVLQRFTRSFKTTSAKKSGHDDPEGFPSANIPISIENKYAVLGCFILFFGSGFSIPFLVLRHQLTK
ncbi:unnamed protein product [Xylocopa violacea]|uniref:Cytochrome c oxidase polypeptide VIIc n=1 Tax=Xylocopa violacea TaxID=135666 RepID=A0ABP1NQK9_XYLVO